ncbi:hypothetical protein [Corynebacterium sp. CNJ-954]|uniref:hypothetical protein n=1 Tax=Corynebacterium sp. CNJ-954 TaxID=1904962 RepID=UPI000A71F18E|nr:hypothetical protein [Corynebacterium sp. CNJ-954]
MGARTGKTTEQRRREFREEKRRRRRWLAAARRAGRIPDGRGLEHSIRVLPRPVPERRAEVLASGRATQTTVRQRFRDLTRGVVVDLSTEDMPEEFRVLPDDCGGFGIDIVTRARAHWMLSVGSVIGFWAAAAFHGLPFWCDDAPVVLLRDGSPRGDARSWVAATTPRVPVFRRHRTGTPVVRPDPEFPDLRAVSADVAAGQCLHSILKGSHGWDVPPVPGLTDREVRSIQFIDAFYQCTWLTAENIRRGSRNYVDRRTVDKLLALSDIGAQSPRETLLRLYTRDVLPEGFSWASQVTVQLDPKGRPWKHLVADLACEELKVALFYDGAYHRAEERRGIDFEQVHRLQALRWEFARIDARLLSDVPQMMEDVDEAVGRAIDRADPPLLPNPDI